MSNLLKVAEAAQALRVSPSLIYKLVERGILGHVRIGAALRFDSEVLSDFIRRHTIKPSAPERSLRKRRAA